MFCRAGSVKWIFKVNAARDDAELRLNRNSKVKATFKI